MGKPTSSDALRELEHRLARFKTEADAITLDFSAVLGMSPEEYERLIPDAVVPPKIRARRGGGIRRTR